MDNIKTMESAALEERLAAIANEATEERSLEELQSMEEEQRAIRAELEARKAAETERRALAEQIVSGAGEIVNEAEPEKETRKMAEIETRNTKAYIDAFAEYIKTEDDSECRALLTENVSGTVPVPELVYDIVKTAWERDEITRRIRKTYLKGNLKVGFEISATGAVKHTEGGDPVTEETLTLGVVNLVPASFKKWISISDEVLDMRGEEFLRYIYDEIVYQIAQAVVNDLLDQIVACGTVATTTQVSVGSVKATQISVGLVAQAMGALSGEANDPLIVMNRATWAAFKSAQAANGYNYDPFEGLPVAFSNHIAAFSAATTGVPYMIVGDFGHGSIANFPNGDDVKFTFDAVTLMTNDLVRVLGREYVAVGPVACNAFTKVVK